ncbi:hypothetical protein ACFQ20_25785, partial [Pseudoroseomonas ludipueritiae]
DFVAQQLASYEVQLRQAERRRAEFQARYIDLLPSEALGGGSRLEAARARLQEIKGELQDANTSRNLIRKQLEAAPPRITEPSVRVSGGSTDVAQAERNLRELRLRFTEQHPDVAAARAALAAARSGGGGGGTRVVTPGAARANPLYEQLKVRLVDVEAQIASLERQERDGKAE